MRIVTGRRAFVKTAGLAACGATLAPGSRPQGRASTAAATAFPLRVSENRRYLVDQRGRPFLVHGESSWEIVWNLTRSEVAEYFAKRAEQGFNATLFNILPDSSDPHTKNRAGVDPFRIPTDFQTTNAAYFDYVEWVVAEAGRRGLAAFIFPCYLGYSTSWIDELYANGEARAADYGRFLAGRFGKHPNVVWVMGGDRDPEYAMKEHAALARAIHAHDPEHLMTFHGREHSSATLFHNEDWLGFNSTYNYAETYTQTHEDWQRQPVKPTLLIESGYERESNDHRYGTPQRLRRQAYWTLLAGSCGHFYGTAFWNEKPGWRESLDWIGAGQMMHVRRLFDALPWPALSPGAEKQAIIEGQGDYGSKEDYVIGAATADWKTAVFYLPIARRLKVCMTRFPAPVWCRWFNPVSGAHADVAAHPLSNEADQWFTPPARDCDSDWVLLLQCGAGKPPSQKPKESIR